MPQGYLSLRNHTETHPEDIYRCLVPTKSEFLRDSYTSKTRRLKTPFYYVATLFYPPYTRLDWRLQPLTARRGLPFALVRCRRVCRYHECARLRESSAKIRINLIKVLCFPKKNKLKTFFNTLRLYAFFHHQQKKPQGLTRNP